MPLPGFKLELLGSLMVSLPSVPLCGVTRLQALFRGRRSRQLHLERVRNNLRACTFPYKTCCQKWS